MATDLTAPTIRQITNRSRGFYQLIGPLLARRAIVAEIGGPVWDDDDKTWFVALANRNVVGFCAARPGRAGTTLYQSAYVPPDHRRQGIYRTLWRARRAVFPGPARATCTAAALPLYLANGWAVANTRGSYTKVVTRDDGDRPRATAKAKGRHP